MEFLKDPWPWYVAGPLIGLIVPLTYYLFNKGFGISSTMKDICAMCMPNTTVSFFKYDWKANAWNLVFAGGIVLGAFIVLQFFPNVGNVDISPGTQTWLNDNGINDLTGLVPIEIFSWDLLFTPVTLISVVFGGFCVGFGTRWAGGCTSGHAITGMSQFNPASLVAVLGFFAGGLLSSWILLPQILKLL